ncbi:MAG: hypothetical protein ACREQD_15860, partial [Candidatus Binataceae bacterium]
MAKDLDLTSASTAGDAARADSGRNGVNGVAASAPGVAKARAIPPATTGSGIELDVLYTPESIGELDPRADIGQPGQYPF